MTHTVLTPLCKGNEGREGTAIAASRPIGINSLTSPPQALAVSGVPMRRRASFRIILPPQLAHFSSSLLHVTTLGPPVDFLFLVFPDCPRAMQDPGISLSLWF